MDYDKNSLDASSVKEIFSSIDGSLRALDEFLEQQVQEFLPMVQGMIRETLRHRGKRLRPALVFLSGLKNKSAPLDKRLVSLAATVELLHLATLVHDDILDDAKLRHSSPTLFAQYGSHTSVLLGDAVFSHALLIVADLNIMELCKVMAKAVRDVCSGEIVQTTNRGAKLISLDEYFLIIEKKTGELFEASAFSGSFLAGDGFQKATDFGNFGKYFGRAYQIFDDIVDLLGKEQNAGKTLRTDIMTGKWTLPGLLYLNTLPETEREETANSVISGKISVNDFIERLLKKGIFEESKAYFLAELEKAELAISKYDDEGVNVMLNLIKHLKHSFERQFDV